MKQIFDNFIIKKLNSDLVNLNYLKSINDKNYSANLVDQKKYSFDQLKKYADNNITDKNYLLIVYDQNINDYIGNIRITIYDKNTGGFGRLVYKKYKGKGYGSKFNEIMKFLNREVFKLKVIKSEVKTNNIGSINSHLKSKPTKNFIINNMHYFEWHFNFE